MPSCFYQRRQWWCCVVSCLFSTGLQWQNGTTEGAYQTLLYYRVKFFKFSLSVSSFLHLFLVSILSSHRGGFSVQQGEDSITFSDLHVWKCSHMSSHYPGSLPADLQAFKGPVFVERKRVCVRREQQTERLLLRILQTHQDSFDTILALCLWPGRPCGEISKLSEISHSTWVTTALSPQMKSCIIRNMPGWSNYRRRMPGFC